MVKAIWNGEVIAESAATKVVEGNHYFPHEDIHPEYFRPNEAISQCGWKGTASYYDIVVGGKVNQQGAWYYPEPKPEAEAIRDMVAFWKGVAIEE